jgi:hypothetical protein
MVNRNVGGNGVCGKCVPQLLCRESTLFVHFSHVMHSYFVLFVILQLKETLLNADAS